MLENTDNKAVASHFGAKLLSVRGRRFQNSAAKFWSALIDELAEDYTGCQRVTLEALNEGRLGPELLFPEIELERELNLLSIGAENVNETWQRALAEFELYGPPGSVALRIYPQSGEPMRLILPMDCVDAEIFLYLLAWLLEWSDLPPAGWNESKIKGAFSATDPVRRFKYSFDFEIEHKPLSEGLFLWRLDLKFERSGGRIGISPPASLEAQRSQR